MKKKYKKILAFILLVSTLVIAFTFFYLIPGGYLFSVLPQPKILREDSYTHPIGGEGQTLQSGAPYVSTYTCPETVDGEEVEVCLMKRESGCWKGCYWHPTGCQPPCCFGCWNFDGSIGDLNPGESVPLCYEPCNLEGKLTYQAVTYHYCGDGDCGDAESCKTCSEDCGECPVECTTASDCEGTPHVLCIGFFTCENNKCVWYCEDGETPPNGNGNGPDGVTPPPTPPPKVEDVTIILIILISIFISAVAFTIWYVNRYRP